MNDVILSGIIQDVMPSHVVGNTEYMQANMITTREDEKQDSVPIKFKKFSNIFHNGEKVDLVGNLRSFSEKLPNGKNKVHLYVFTYFDPPSTDESFSDVVNRVTIDGRICKKDILRTTQNGKTNIHFILANNIITPEGQKINNYIPTVAWGKLAPIIDSMHVSDQIKLKGEIHSRIYRKNYEDGSMEIKTAYELVVTEVVKVQ